MEQKQREQIALFRFQVIAPFLSIDPGNRGERERLVREICGKQWEIPGSSRSYIGRSTVLGWLRRYEAGGKKLESLCPQERSDRGRSRALDEETEAALLRLRREFRGATIPFLMKKARERRILPPDFRASRQSIYRLLARHGLMELERENVDRRKFEAELPNDLWQSDCMHGPRADCGGVKRKTFLFAFIDDHSRLIPAARFYARENIGSFLDLLVQAVSRRGLPRKIYVDNGPSFRSHQLRHTTASLGIALIHATPYQPQGKGKIERWFRTVRMGFLPGLEDGIALEQLNEKFEHWLEHEYHNAVHSSTGETPLTRFLRHVHLIRQAPRDLLSYFRKRALRKVENDRSVSLNGRLYEGPVELIGRKVQLLYHEDDMERVEVVYSGKSFGFLTVLDVNVNARVRRNRGRGVELVPGDKSPQPHVEGAGKPLCGGELFGERM